MHVELFMTSLDQEFSAETVSRMRSTALGDAAGASSGKDAMGSWTNWTNWTNWNNWTNWVNASAKPRPVAFNKPLIERLKPRPEAFGGLALDPITRRVFRLDHEAYEALCAMQRAGKALAQQESIVRYFDAFQDT